jgi:histidyl-tRNA synthetase
LELRAVRGMKDLTPPNGCQWRLVEDTARRAFMAFGFAEMRPPLLEATDLFSRAVGQSTDIVEKEMYTFSDRGGASLTLRPEATAGVIRAYIEHKIYANPGPHKFFTIGPMFRYERPQKGRLRQFHQLNCELLDDPGPYADAELMIMLVQILSQLNLQGVRLLLNSLGCDRCRPAYRQLLLDFLKNRQEALCPDCLRRLEINPLRSLDCKQDGCRQATADAPRLLDHICSDCARHFDQVQKLLQLAGVEFVHAPRLVRGLDYYQRTTFEAVCGDLGAQNAVAGGGRYDGLIAQLGGPPQAGMGFALGLERLLLLLNPLPAPGPQLLVAALGEDAYNALFPLVMKLRAQGVTIDFPAPGRGLKNLLRRADKINAVWVAMAGDNELTSGVISVKDLALGRQLSMSLPDFMDWAQSQKA